MIKKASFPFVPPDASAIFSQKLLCNDMFSLIGGCKTYWEGGGAQTEKIKKNQNRVR